jgi:hypothetical protein
MLTVTQSESSDGKRQTFANVEKRSTQDGEVEGAC